MSVEKKDKKSIMAKLLGIVTGLEGLGKAKIVALDLTTKEGEKITFADVPDGELPKAGDTATIDGQPVIDKTVTIVDNDGEFTIVFDAEGKVVQEQTEEEKTIEALQTENAELKANITAMASEFRATLRALSGEEEEEEQGKNDANKGKTVTAVSLDKRLKDLREKKEKAKRSTVQ